MIFSKDMADHFKHLETTIIIIAGHGLHINHKKSQICLQEVKFIRFIVKQDKLNLEISKIEGTIDCKNSK